MRSRRSSLWGALLLLLASSLSGCGGGGAGQSSSAAFRMQIKWPTRNSRVVPRLADRIRLRVSDAATSLVDQVIERPADGSPSNISIKGLPKDTPLTVSCDAYQNAAATILARASAPVTLKGGSDNVVVLDLVSTIDRLSVDVGSTLSILGGQTQTLTVTAMSASDEVIPIADGNLSFEGGVNGVFSVSSAGVVTAGLNVGEGDILIRERESGKTTTVHVSVGSLSGVDHVSFNPLTGLAIAPNQTVTLQAKAYDNKGNVVPGATIVYSTQSPNVSIVGDQLKGLSITTGTILVTAKEITSGRTATLPVVVRYGPLKTLALSPNETTIYVINGPSTVTFTATGTDNFGNSFTVPNTSLNWDVVSSGQYVQVDSSGTASIKQAPLSAQEETVRAKDPITGTESTATVFVELNFG